MSKKLRVSEEVEESESALLGTPPDKTYEEKVAEQALVSPEGSLKLMRLSTIMKISTILYHRHILPAAAFHISKVRKPDFHMPWLKDPKDPDYQTMPKNNPTLWYLLARRIYNWLMAAMEAINDKYLETMVLRLMGDCCDEDSIMETYRIDFQYMDQAATGYTGNVDPRLAKAIIDTFVRAHKITIRYSSVELKHIKQRGVKMYLYYNDAAPEHYKLSNGFISSVNTEYIYLNNKYIFSTTSTPFNTFKLTLCFRDQSYIEEVKSKIEMMKYNVVCPCGTRNYNGWNMVQCCNCYKFEHGACIGRLIGLTDRFYRNHICISCLPGVDNRTFGKLMKICLTRLALEYCLIFNKVNSETFRTSFLITEFRANTLMIQLNDLKLFKAKHLVMWNPENTYTVHKGNLKANIQRYFAAFIAEVENKGLENLDY